MKQQSSILARRRSGIGKGRLVTRLLRRGLLVSLVLLVLAGVGLGLLYLRLSAGPMSVARLSEQLAASIATRIGPGWKVSLRDTALQMTSGALAVQASGLDIRDPDGALVLRAPHAIVSVDALSLFVAHLQPRAMEFRDLQLRAVLNSDGSLSFTPGVEVTQESARRRPAAAGPISAPETHSPVSVAVGSLFDMLVGQSGLLGVLDQAQITNARLTLVDTEGKERSTFSRVSAKFERTVRGGRRFDATLDGPGGVWQLSGDATANGSGGYEGTLRGTNAPVQDILLLSGLSGIPATTDLKISGRADAAFAGGRVTRLSVAAASNAGVIQIDDKDTGPQPVDSVRVEAQWEEGRRTLALRNLEFKGGGSLVRLEGDLLAPPGGPGWVASLRGRNGLLGGLAARDAPVVVDDIRARIHGRDGLILEQLVLRGPTLSVDLSGRYGSAADPRRIEVNGRATGTGVRSALRLWPEAVAPAVRRYLVANLRSGTAERLDLSVAMSGLDVSMATAHGPIPDESVKVEFAVRDVELSAAEGLPPVTEAGFTGTVSGLRARVSAPSGRIAMPDARTLNASGGFLTVNDFWVPDATARIGFKLDGGADALASLLQAPLMREIAGLDLDPTIVKGRTELRVEIPLAVKHIPRFVDLPMAVAGVINDLSVEKVFGKDRLEGANLVVVYDRGTLGIKGEGRLAGSPALVEVQQVRGQGGDVTISMTLDEAARARKGMSLGAQLTGPLPVKATQPIGGPGKSDLRIEVDLARAAVDQVIPGWVKPAGRPGRLSFTLVEGNGSELRDVVLDSGSVQLRGTALLSPEGQVEKADLSTFKLSPGDDMRAQLERAGGTFRVVVRGNVGDARPFTKVIGSAPPGRTSLREQRDSKDFDIDLALNILTGHNDETITNAVAKVSMRQGSLRQLQLSGRIGSSSLTGQTLSRSGQSLVIVQAQDAGSVLRFLDVYRRMVGGDFHLQLGTGDGPQTGFMNLGSFSLRNEPALRRIIPTQSQLVTTEDRGSGRSKSVLTDVNEAEFTRAHVDFTRSSGRLDFKDAAIWSSDVGFTLDGFIDFARDRTDISGTFVPAYGVNNVFSQVPLFGPLLGGGRNEGLIGVNFRVSGQATAPVLTVNPLSAIAPGFLRKFFGASNSSDRPTLPIPEGTDR